MIKSITFNKVTLSKARNYMTDLPCLIGKTFEFKPGANILCGYTQNSTMKLKEKTNERTA